ncbi:hypothetical protein JOL79_31665 [Microbispora sp. RL4-1S]|uniref:Peptide zinc metalloprotease protein n=1 Tax=Microbispora oryzae TaxID=2806554 RepID=A0A940WMT2_9ACTN|nr:daptide biosynthesis intramembrane metalloprotease [Microbispora oryzae]MBP2708346.1 hypothetical protein [Microbispora oryzae]
MRGLKLKAAIPEPRRPVLLERPRLAADVLVHEPVKDGGPWIVQSAGQRYVRVGGGMARILLSADGGHTLEDIANELGDPWTAELVGHGLLKAQEMKLLDDGQAPAKKRLRWFTFVPPLTFQFTLLNPDRLLSRARPLLARLATRAWAAAMLTLIVGGLVTLAVQASALREVLGEPLPVTAFLILFCVTWAGSALHEMTHAAVLSHHGGRPSRMGLMLFYLTPAFFCDVSDGWRLPRNQQRVATALAGVACQAVIGGLAAVAALLTHGGTLRDALLLVAVSSYVAGIVNLVPFAKLDGYLALMSHLDISHLRDRSMDDARRSIARVLFGGHYERALPQVSWSRWFGLACLLFPIYLVGTAFTLWQSLLAGMGLVGAVIVSLLLGYLLLRLYASARRLVAEARAAGARTWRVVIASVLVIGAAGAILHQVTVPYTVAGGFVRDGDQVMFVVLGNADRGAIAPGSEVRLREGGIVLHSDLGKAAVTAGSPRNVSVPLSVFVPVRDLDHVSVPAVGFPLTAQSGAVPPYGPAEVAAGERSLGEWLYLRYVAPFWR